MLLEKWSVIWFISHETYYFRISIIIIIIIDT